MLDQGGIELLLRAGEQGQKFFLRLGEIVDQTAIGRVREERLSAGIEIPIIEVLQDGFHGGCSFLAY